MISGRYGHGASRLGHTEARCRQADDAIDKALSDEDTRNRLPGSVMPEADGRGQLALAALVRSELARWMPLINAAQ
jgi:hypothetical protein